MSRRIVLKRLLSFILVLAVIASMGVTYGAPEDETGEGTVINDPVVDVENEDDPEKKLEDDPEKKLEDDPEKKLEDGETPRGEVFTVTYHADADGMTGSLPVDGNTYAEGESAVVLNGEGLGYSDTLIDEGGEPFDVDYVFYAWSASPDDDEHVYLPGEVIEVTGDIDLYALCHSDIQAVFTAEQPVGGLMMAAGAMGIMAADASPQQPGELVIDKTAAPNSNTSPENDLWLWDIELTLKGLDIRTTSDVVLVIDRSGSMAGDKMTNTKNAARAFVSNLLANGNTRIAVVSFAGDVTTNSTFSTNTTTLNNAINGLNATGGTNIQGGLHAAQALLASTASTGNKKYIVILGDGQPTYSQLITAASGVTYNHIANNNHSWSVNTANYGFTFNYNTLVGDGSNFTSSSTSNSNWTALSVTCNNTGTTKHTGSWRPDNHGIPTIYEAGLAKAAGTEIYSIAFNSDTNGQNVLRSCASSTAGTNDHYFAVTGTNTSGLTTVFNAIAGSIIYAARNAVVTDPMGMTAGLEFDLTDAAGQSIIALHGPNPTAQQIATWIAANVKVSHGTVTYNVNTETLTWNIGDIRESEGTYWMRYTVRINTDPNVTDPDTMYKTNDITPVHYTDTSGNNTHKNFPLPEAGYPQVGTIIVIRYLLNDAGQPLTLQGNPTTNRELINYHDRYLFEVWRDINGNMEWSTAIPYNVNPYSVAPIDDTIVVGGVTYYLVPGTTTNLGDTSPKDVLVNVANQNPRVYFAYARNVPAEVIFNQGDHGTITGANASGNLVHSGLYIGDNLPAAPVPIPAPGFRFTGWLPDYDTYGGKVKVPTVTFVAQYEPIPVSLTLLKENEYGTAMQGVKFRLSVFTPSPGGGGGWDSYPAGTDGIQTTDADGKIPYADLPNGRYMLEETATLPGYGLISGYIYFKVEAGAVTITDANGDAYTPTASDPYRLSGTGTAEDPFVLTVLNLSQVELPDTGGIGTTVFTIVGVAIILAAIVLLVVFLKRGGKRKV